MCVCVCVRACACAFVRACVRACVCVCECMRMWWYVCGIPACVSLTVSTYVADQLVGKLRVSLNNRKHSLQTFRIMVFFQT